MLFAESFLQPTPTDRSVHGSYCPGGYSEDEGDGGFSDEQQADCRNDCDDDKCLFHNGMILS
jgi:hypothetical protein